MSDRRTTSQALREYARGLGGGVIFGLPILYTEEIWVQGLVLRPWRMLLFLAVQYLGLLAYVYYAGFRYERTLRGVAFEAVEALGLAWLISAAVLYLLDRITWGMPGEEILGKILLATIPVSVGVAVATVELADKPREAERRVKTASTLGQYLLALGGAVYFAFSFGPTYEIVVIGNAIGFADALLLIAASLAITYALVFYAGIRLGGSGSQPEGILESPIGETVTAYALALVVAAGVLIFFGRAGLSQGLDPLLPQAIVLGLPAGLGAALGRLLL